MSPWNLFDWGIYLLAKKQYIQLNTENQQFREEIVICALFFVKTCGEYIKLTIVTIQLQGSPGKYILISPPGNGSGGHTGNGDIISGMASTAIL